MKTPETRKNWSRMTNPKKDPKIEKGFCELCGGQSQELRILVSIDFVGWACEECRGQLQDCQPRRFCNAGGETEPGE